MSGRKEQGGGRPPAVAPLKHYKLLPGRKTRSDDGPSAASAGRFGKNADMGIALSLT